MYHLPIPEDLKQSMRDEKQRYLWDVSDPRQAREYEKTLNNMTDLRFMYQQFADESDNDEYAEEVYRVMKQPTRYEAREFLKSNGITRLLSGSANNSLQSVL